MENETETMPNTNLILTCEETETKFFLIKNETVVIKSENRSISSRSRTHGKCPKQKFLLLTDPVRLRITDESISHGSDL